MPAKRIFVNEDDAHFYACHPAEDMTVEGLRNLVDYYAEGTQVGGVLFCASMQKANFDSRTREPLFEGYDPDGGEEQPFLSLLAPKLRKIIPGDHARNWIHNLWLLQRGRGIDHLAVWLERCRHHGIEGWLTVRMNDCHGLEEYAQRLSGAGDYDGWALLCPSEFWKRNPELRRAPYRWERSWEGAFNYAKKQVRDHYLALLKELLERYDMHGLEMDWLRWGMNFTPGREQEGRAFLNDFVREVRRLVKKAARRRKHPVLLSARLPAEPQNALALGYDVLTWAKEKLVDQVVLSGMGNVANFAPPVDLWRTIFGPKVRLLALTEDVVKPYPAFGNPVANQGIYYGCAASVLHRGADGLYLFNECYKETREPDRTQFKTNLKTLGDLKTLGKEPRRHVVTYPQFYAAGDSARTVLPIPLRSPAVGADLGRMEQNISVRVALGPAPQTGRAVAILGFSPDAPPLQARRLPLYINGEKAAPCKAKVKSSLQENRIGWARKYNDRIGKFLQYELPLAALHDDVNCLEFVPPDADGELRWVEILVDPKAH